MCIKFKVYDKFCSFYNLLRYTTNQSKRRNMRHTLFLLDNRNILYICTCVCVLVPCLQLSWTYNYKFVFYFTITNYIFILPGLCFAVGIILYISSINDEVGHRQYNNSGDLVFKYNYGWSFYFAGLAFLFTMLSSVMQITLYLKRNSKKDDMVQIIPGLDDVFECSTDELLEHGSSNPIQQL